MRDIIPILTVTLHAITGIQITLAAAPFIIVDISAVVGTPGKGRFTTLIESVTGFKDIAGFDFLMVPLSSI